MIVREDMDAARKDCGPEVADELQVDLEALALAGQEVAEHVAPLFAMVGVDAGVQAIWMQAIWMQGFMAGVRAGRGDS